MRMCENCKHFHKVPDESEADKVIAHQKYKRCLAMAEACMYNRWRTDGSTRHMNKWLELAEKFKEAK